MSAPTLLADEPTDLAAGGENAVAVAIGLIGDEWNLWLLRTALQGDRRYNDWLRHGVVSNAVLTQRLAGLTDRGVLERHAYAERPVRHEYRLSGRGRELWPVLLSIWAWERAWAGAGHEQLPTMRHGVCGAAFSPVLTCAQCGEPVEARDVTGRLGQSADRVRTIPSSATRRRSRDGSALATIPETVAVIGNRWSCALLGAAFLGATRFGELLELMGAPPTVVADRLRTFCAAGVLAAAPSPDRPDWVTYHLTDKGRAFFPVLVCSLDWAQRWYVAPDGPAVMLRHTTCRAGFTPRLACDRCGQALHGADVQEGHRLSGPPGRHG